MIATQSVEAVFHSPSMMKILKSGELESYQQQLRQCRIKGVYDWNKAFDCINSIQALKELGIGSRDRIISLGAYHDSSLQILDALGYEKLYGIDKNSDIYNNHNYNRIRYFWGNIENTHFPGSFFDCGVCLSVIEHHVNHEDFLSETYRILKPGSPLIVSTDFFPEKIHLAFGNRARQKLGRLSWKVFSTNELLDFIDLAGRRGFVPLFDVDELRSYKIRDRPIKHLGVQYTFAFMVFRRRNEIPVRPRGGSGISILLPCNPNEIGGISIYSNLLVRRFSKAGIESEVVYNPAQARYDKVLIEAAHGLSGSNELPAIIGKLQSQRKEVYTEYHDCILNSSDFRHYVANNSVLIYRANEVAQYDGIDDYLIAPITSYDLNVDDKAPKEICLGTFGFGYRSKRIEEVIRLARKLNLKAKIVTSVNTESLKDQTETEITRLRKLSTERIEVISGVTMDGGDGEKTIIEVLSECSHFIFAHMNSLGASGTMTFVKCFHRPIVALDSFQAVQAQVIRVPMLASRASPVGYQTLEFVMGLFVRRRSIRSLLLRILKLVHAKPVTREYLNHFARQPKIGLRTFLREISRVMRARPVTRQYLDDLAQRQITSRDDDGFDYLLNILDFGKA